MSRKTNIKTNIALRAVVYSAKIKGDKRKKEIKISRVELFRVIYGVYYTIKRLFYGSSGYRDTHLKQTI